MRPGLAFAKSMNPFRLFQGASLWTVRAAASSLIRMRGSSGAAKVFRKMSQVCLFVVSSNKRMWAETSDALVRDFVLPDDPPGGLSSHEGQYFLFCREVEISMDRVAETRSRGGEGDDVRVGRSQVLVQEGVDHGG